MPIINFGRESPKVSCAFIVFYDCINIIRLDKHRPQYKLVSMCVFAFMFVYVWDNDREFSVYTIFKIVKNNTQQRRKKMTNEENKNNIYSACVMVRRLICERPRGLRWIIYIWYYSLFSHIIYKYKLVLYCLSYHYKYICARTH